MNHARMRYKGSEEGHPLDCRSRDFALCLQLGTYSVGSPGSDAVDLIVSVSLENMA